MLDRVLSLSYNIQSYGESVISSGQEPCNCVGRDTTTFINIWPQLKKRQKSGTWNKRYSDMEQTWFER